MHKPSTTTLSYPSTTAQDAVTAMVRSGTLVRRSSGLNARSQRRRQESVCSKQSDRVHLHNDGLSLPLTFCAKGRFVEWCVDIP